MIPRRCTCGVHNYDRCPDHNKPEHHPDDRMPPVWAAVFSIVGCILAGGAVVGALYAWQAIFP